ncbi:putative inhibitor of apoptosis [Palaemon carinicauda]|uniref:putative inhibitor of apoptosis n=1 Tax=Palaemon carinicauda TaxID=392227 RepID=UPI0035B646BC
MGEANSDIQLLEEEEHRLSTFGAQNFIASIENAQLAKAGFFFSSSDKIVKCFSCNVELKASDVQPGFKVLSFHKEKSADCPFIKKLISQKIPRWKSFLSVADSLRFEKARADTFVDWPLTFLSPEKLAEDGFYYLRRRDHCACIFCRGIIGAWEETDTPRGEHSKHFPQCPFIKGKPVGNIPMKQSLILQKFSNFSCDKVCNPLELNIRTTSADTTTTSGDGDVTGLGRQSENCPSRITEKKNGINLKDFGLHEYRGPKHKEYITLDSRVNSFKHWPEGVKQQPCQLAEAGFYYCGPGDQVRCFHCGNGICNWEDEDVPWEIHALLYPKCSYVLLTMGQEYVDKMQNRPLNINFENMEKFVISESELDALMELDIMCEVKALNFPEAHIKEVLRNRVETKGIPFFTAEQCATAVFEYVEEKTRMFLEETYMESNDDEVTDVNSRDIEPASTSVTPPDTAAALPGLPPNTTSSSVIPLPQIKRHIPISPLPRPTSLNSPQTTVPSVVNGSCGLQQSLSYENLPSESQNRMQRSLPLLTQMDFSEERKVMPLSCELPSLGMKKSASLGEDKSSDKLREELDRARETVMCKVCLNADMSIVFLPCSHMATCAACAVNLSKCPVCREEIKYTIKPIFS